MKQTHEETIARGERNVAMKIMRHEREYQRLRAELVEKYGEEGVKKVEERITKEDR